MRESDLAVFDEGVEDKGGPIKCVKDSKVREMYVPLPDQWQGPGRQRDNEI